MQITLARGHIAAARPLSRASRCLLIPLFVSVLVQLPLGQQFGPGQILTPVADGPHSVIAADLDGDGDRDALSASTADDKVAWYENVDGLGSFEPQQVITTEADGAWAVCAADLDGDGDTDVLSASQNDATIAWYENLDGLGGFGSRQPITSAALGARSVIASDLDGDGDQDVLSASTADHKIAWYENADGLGSFGPQQIITAAAIEAMSVRATDLDGDGDRDVLSSGSTVVAWYENTDGLGSFGPQQAITSSAIGAYPLCAADLDGDGDQDVISAGDGNYTLAWYENTDGLGSFAPQQVIEPHTEWLWSVFAVDLDRDGDRDVLSATALDGAVAWYENTDGLGTFGPRQAITTAAIEAYSVFGADLDADGDQDVLSASLDDRVAWYENRDGLGTFGSPKLLTPVANGACSVSAADLNGDGHRDVLSASQDDDTIAWYPNADGHGTFVLQHVITTAADSASTVSAADLDGDGDRDVLSASYADDKIAWYENTDGRGTFGRQEVVTAGADGASSALAADLDGEGDLDVLSASTGDPMLAWYENTDGLGNFGPKVLLSSTAKGADSVFATDLDADGDRDVLSAAFSLSEVAWYENTDGLGAFGPPQTITLAGLGPRSVFAADLDRDGDQDVLSASSKDGEIAWFENLQAPLMTSVHGISLASGGPQPFELAAGAQHRLELYLLLGSLSGTSPGLLVDGLVLPLTPDIYFLHTLGDPNSSSLVSTLGFLAANGTASAALVLPPGLNPALAGSTVHHAYGVFDLTSTPGSPFLCFASNAVPLLLEP